MSRLRAQNDRTVGKRPNALGLSEMWSRVRKVKSRNQNGGANSWLRLTNL